MPLFKRQPFSATTSLELFRDSDEVFYCEQTREIFSSYDDYFNRTMLLSSTLWSCAYTGRSNLTYADALECENAAKRTLKEFPAALKGPILLVASNTKRTAIHDLAGDVYGFLKDVFMKGETVYAKMGSSEIVRKAKVTSVEAGKSNDQDATKLIYHLESIDNSVPRHFTSPGAAVYRERNTFSRDKCKLFLKQHVELGPDQMLVIKKKSLDRLVVSKGCTSKDVFHGKVPSFEVSKKLLARKGGPEDGIKAKKKVLPNSTKTKGKGPEKANGVKSAGNKKQQSIAQYLQTSDDPAVSKEAIATKMAMLKEKAEQEAIEKEQKLKEKALLMEQVSLALKEYRTIKEDQELKDQRVIPPVCPVQSLIGNAHFSNFMFILEFMTSFGDLLSIEDKFPNGITMDLLERALLVREVNGPLSDILQVLLTAIFAQQDEEDTEETAKQMRTIHVYKWCKKHLSTKLNELPMDGTTVSELLRLHLLLSSQLYRSGDPCFQLNLKHKHIIRDLASCAVYQLSVDDIIQLICALIHQFLEGDEVHDRIEQAREDQTKCKVNRLEQHRMPLKIASLKAAARDNMKKELATFQGQTDDTELEKFRAKLDQNLVKEYARIEADARQRMKQLQSEMEQLQLNNCYYQEYLGADRGFRNYWQFQSLPGLFVEHDRIFAGHCMDRATKNIPSLANCESMLRKKFITNSIMKCAGSSNPLQDNGTVERNDDVYEQLLILGCELMEKEDARKKELEPKESQDAPEEAVDPLAPVDAQRDAPVAMTNDISSPPPTNTELFMCTGVPENCPVHTQLHPDTVSWGYYKTAEELDALINSLNERGVREKRLRESLVLNRDLIVAHMETFPVEKLSVAEDDRDAHLNDIIKRHQKTYGNANFYRGSDLDPNQVLESVFRDSLIEMEVKITTGCLGKIKVPDIEKWRTNILEGSYDSQTNEELQWGLKRLPQVELAFKNLKNRITNEENQPDEETKSMNIDTVGSTSGNDHGGNGSNATVMNGAVESGEKEAPRDMNHKVHAMAQALLQIEQSIEPKFLRPPFGPKGTITDKTVQMTMQYMGQKKLLQWEVSLMKSTSFSQLFLHYHVLHDAVQWSRSIERAKCIVCRCKGDPEQTLLCDDCNRACHMYCLKPKLDKVPTGDWFCMRCQPENHRVTRSAKAMKRRKPDEDDSDDESEVEEVEEEVEEEEEEEQEDEEAEVESEEEVMLKKTIKDNVQSEDDSEDDTEIDEGIDLLSQSVLDAPRQTRKRTRARGKTQDVEKVQATKRSRLSTGAAGSHAKDVAAPPDSRKRNRKDKGDSNSSGRTTRLRPGRRKSPVSNGTPEVQLRRSRRTIEL